MSENNREDSQSVYELGYLIVSSIPEEKILAEGEAVRSIISAAGASVIAEEAPRSQRLAYTMRKKNPSGSYEKYDNAYFGWIKFDLDPAKIDGVRKAVEAHQSVLRSMVMTTTKENTYLGKRASAVAADFGAKRSSSDGAIAEAAGGPVSASARQEDKKEAPPASIEDMDKSIEEMVKEV